MYTKSYATATFGPRENALTLDLRVRDVIAHVVEGDDEAVTTWKITCLGELC